MLKKDIANLTYALKKNNCKSVEAITKMMDAEFPSYSYKFQTVGNEVKSIMIQSAKMREDFAKYPELLFSNSTYKLNVNDIPLYALIGCDGEGKTRPVSLFLVTDETEETIRNMLELFKADNPKWEQIRVVLTDKDMSQRKCFKEAFPQIDLQLCLFHVLRNFNREISCAKHNISSEERNYIIRAVF